MKILVIGLPGTGKSTYVRNHLVEDAVAYDLDELARAFRMGLLEGYHCASRAMANDLIYGFVQKAEDYARTAYIIRTAPTLQELGEINPDRIVVCTRIYDERDYTYARKEDMEQRIADVVAHAKAAGIEVREII